LKGDLGLGTQIKKRKQRRNDRRRGKSKAKRVKEERGRK
jgi:hypothetical protein